jgi:signal transduction histidine kinase
VADLRGGALRALLLLALVVTGLVEIQGLVQTLRSQSRVRERVIQAARDAAATARPRLQTTLQAGGEASWSEAADDVLRFGLASEVEVFEFSKRRMLARPYPAPVEHWPSPAEMRAIQGGANLVVGPLTHRATRLLTYSAFRSGDGDVLLRLSAAIPELLQDLDERRQVVLGHGLALAMLVGVAALLLFPGRFDPGPAPPRALHAYEEAMGRLRVRGDELSREHEAELRRLSSLLQDREAMARAGELAAGIAHEVRNGLATILGYARLVERGQADPKEAGSRISEECETLEGVVRRFMDFVKNETLELARFDLQRLLSRVVARESRSEAASRIELSAAEVLLVGDEELLERAFENLVRNAREAAGSGGRVSVEVRVDAASAVVTVADDGPGLPAEARGQIRPFFTTKAGGVGLGLPLALKIVRLHQGELALLQRIPRGLAVQVQLPVAGPGHARVVTDSSNAATVAGGATPCGSRLND